MVFGGLPEKDALYLPGTPARNDGATIHELTVQGEAVRGFWSIHRLQRRGYLEPNQYNAYSVNRITAKKEWLGHPVRRLQRRNSQCLPITKGWNYAVRFLSPAIRILDGTWKIPGGAASELSSANILLVWASERQPSCPSMRCPKRISSQCW